MTEPADDRAVYAADQDREPPRTARSDWQQAADLNPDDFGPGAEDEVDVNPATGVEYGEVETPIERGTTGP